MRWLLVLRAGCIGRNPLIALLHWRGQQLVSRSAHRPGCLSSPSLVQKIRKVPGKPPVLSQSSNLGDASSDVSERNCSLSKGINQACSKREGQVGNWEAKRAGGKAKGQEGRPRGQKENKHLSVTPLFILAAIKRDQQMQVQQCLPTSTKTIGTTLHLSFPT